LNETAGHSDRRSLFSAGIAFGLTPAMAHRAGSHTLIVVRFAASATALLMRPLSPPIERAFVAKNLR
jgi:hypothetical protein